MSPPIRFFASSARIRSRSARSAIRSELALKLKPLIAEKAKEKQLSTLTQNAVNQNSDERKELNTNKELARAAGVSHDTIHKAETGALMMTPREDPDQGREHEDDVRSAILSDPVACVRDAEDICIQCEGIIYWKTIRFGPERRRLLRF